jgi:hypothetical protein
VVGVLSETDGLVCLLAEKYGGRRGSKESYYESPLVQSLQGILASHIYISIGSESIGSEPSKYLHSYQHFLSKKRLIEGTNKSQALERGNHS